MISELALMMMATVAGTAAVWVRGVRKRLENSFGQPGERVVSKNGGLVAAYHPQARAIGEGVLASGGNAFDAFVAAVAAENVLAEGASSLAGPLAVMTWQKASGELQFLDANFNDPLDANWRWTPKMPKDGSSILVPGAPAGLEALAARYGSRSFSELLQPAISLATEGFPVCNLMAKSIALRSRVLRRTDYGRKTFFDANGKPLARGSVLRQPKMGSFLSKLASEGARHVYGGDWGARFLKEVTARQGVLSELDLRAYAVKWEEPWSALYRGRTIYSCPGYGGLWTMLALKTIEHANLPEGPHYSTDADLLEMVLRVAKEVWAESWIFSGELGEQRKLVESRLSADYARSIWDRVVRGGQGFAAKVTGSHSFHISVVDKEGNVVSGTTTIEDEPWGKGIFVEGIPLSTAGTIPWSTGPGKRRLNPFSTHFVFEAGQMRFAAGAISNSAAEAGFQFLVNLIDYKYPVEEAVTRPRFGTFPSLKKRDLDRNWLDPRIDSETVRALEKRGHRFQRGGIVDTGLGNVLAIEAGGNLAWASVPVPYVTGPFE